MVKEYDNYLLDSIAEIPEKIINFFQMIIDTILLVVEALKTFYDMLVDFDKRIIAMADSCGTSEFTGMPVVEAISTFRYLTGDVAFYMIYFTVMFGCLFTIYKLMCLLYTAVDLLVEKITGNSLSGNISGLLSKFLN